MAVIMISINGFKWVAAGGNQSTIGKAKSGVFTAIIGLFLLFASYMILNTVNSQLTLLKMPNVEPITADYLDLEDPEDICRNKGGYVYEMQGSKCICDSSGVKESYRIDNPKVQASWGCCVCNGCPDTAVKDVNNVGCSATCEAKECFGFMQWSPQLPNCCSCSSCKNPIVPPVHHAECVNKPMYTSCTVPGGVYKDHPGYCQDSTCHVCINVGEKCKDSRGNSIKSVCQNYNPGSNNNKCGLQYIDSTVECISYLRGFKCRDSDL